MKPGITLHCDWSPSRASIAGQLGGITLGGKTLGGKTLGGKTLGGRTQAAPLLDIPTDQSNLVFRTLADFSQKFSVAGGFECWLEKQIPAGAGMGGASSDAASALLCAAALCSVDAKSPLIYEIASAIGSDVPFFLGAAAAEPNAGKRSNPSFAARAQGRGTKITPVPIGFRPHIVAAFPGVSLSTAKVYAQCQVPELPVSADQFLNAWKHGDQQQFGLHKMNRLAEPARKLSKQIDEILESMWRSGARTCQLTGSGSACFAIVGSARAARTMAMRLRAMKKLHAVDGTGTRMQVDTTENSQASSQVIARATTLQSVPAPLKYRRI